MHRNDKPDDRTTADLAPFGLDDAEAWLDHVRAVVSPESLGCIGSYEIVREVARGGQGVVYEARRADTGRRFALKRLLAGALATDSARRRFERELSVATSLDHPHVVAAHGMEVIDGQPLLAMEWIDGVPITEWAGLATARPRSRHERLDVFMKVCDAVHYAHRNGVIHRDLKPTNILVTSDGEPRVLDFGLARHDRLVVDSLTRTSQFLGTPAYAAPEQLLDDAHGVDLRADVYALGLILYQLITERMPYPTEGSFPSVVNHIMYTEPARPSAIGVRLARDLETIFLKCLAKRPDDRYQSVEALATDLQRHRADQPIVAVTPGWTYVMGKTIRRHPVAFPVVVLSALCVVLSGLVAGVFGIAATKARHDEAKARRVAEATSVFLQDLLATADPDRHGGDVKVVALLEEAADRVERELSAEPLAAADVLMTIGDTYYALWMTERSEPYFRRALTLYRKVHGQMHADVARALSKLGGVLSFQDRAEAIDCQREALKINTALYGPDDANVAESMHSLAFALYRGASPPDYAAAERWFHEALARKRRVFTEPHGSIAITLHAHAAMMSRQGRHDESLAMYRQALAMNREVYGESSTRVLECLDDYAAALVRADRAVEAVAIQEQAVETSEQLLGLGWSSGIMARLAKTHRQLGDADEAARLCDEAMRRYFIMLASYPERVPPGVGSFLLRWSSAPTDDLRTEFRRQILETVRTLPTDCHVNAAVFTDILMTMAATLADAGDEVTALCAAHEALRARSALLERGHWRIAESKYVIGRILAAQGDAKQSESMLTEALIDLRASRGDQHPLTQEVRSALARSPNAN